MLARQLPGVSVLASSDRYLAGRLAEHHLGATVHVLDDGFQHLQLDRDVDLVIVAGEDLEADARTLPGGRLREPPDTLLAADAILAADERVFALGRGRGTHRSRFSACGARWAAQPAADVDGAAGGGPVARARRHRAAGGLLRRTCARPATNSSDARRFAITTATRAATSSGSSATRVPPGRSGC